MIKLGTMVRFSHETQGLGELKTAFENVKKYGLPTCQLCCWDMSKFTDENAAGIRFYFNRDLTDNVLLRGLPAKTKEIKNKLIAAADKKCKGCKKTKQNV